jgi:hypothetical protein
MVLYCTAVNENVFEVNNDETIQVCMEDIFHEGHECGRGVAKSKTEDGEFKAPVAGSKRCFGNGIFLQPNLMITGTKVNLCEEFSASELIKDIINAR